MSNKGKVVGGILIGAAVGLAAAIAGYALHESRSGFESKNKSDKGVPGKATGGTGSGGAAVGATDEGPTKPSGACHGHGHHHGHGDGGKGCGGHSREHGHAFKNPAEYAALMERPEREAWQKPEEFIRDVLKPLLATFEGDGKQRIIADVGAGTGYMTVRMARALPDAQIIASDTEASMRTYLEGRVASEKLSNVRVAAADAEPPAKAHVAVFLAVYHHINNRIDFLTKFAATSLKENGYIIVIEHKTGDLPIVAPPEAMRLERSTIREEFEHAGFALIQTPAVMPYHHVLVFQKQAAA